MTAVIAFTLAISAGAFTYLRWDHPNLAEVQKAVAETRLADAEIMARRWLEIHPEDPDGLLLLGEVLQRQGSLFEALEVYQRVPKRATAALTIAQLSTVSILLKQGRLADAESKLKKIAVDPSHAQTADGLWASLFSLSGRQQELIPTIYRTLDSVGDPLTKLIQLANPDEMLGPPDDVFAKMYQVRDPLCLLGCGRMAAGIGRKEQAIQLLRDCLSKRPDLSDAWAALALVLIDVDKPSEFDEWLKTVPIAAKEHPTIWFLLGRRAQESGYRREAIRCFWEALRRSPDHDRATYQLGQLLASEGRLEEAKEFTDRAQRLTQLIEASVRLYDNVGAIPEMEKCARLTYELGRFPEFRAWYKQLESVAPENPIVSEFKQLLVAKVQSESQPLRSESNLAIRFDFSSYPLPNQASSSSNSTSEGSSNKSTNGQIAFVDDAARLGLRFVYYNSDDPSSSGKRMFEYTGGGVAAIDYDRDGWCDIYLTQGTNWPPDLTNKAYVDAMYRNVEGISMSDVTTEVRIADCGFGQGVASGDFDNDGFADLYVANIDGNRLYRNNGDGTFTDITESTGLGQHRDWTSSCLLADLDGDALPDVYDVTFLSGEGIFTKICQGSDGVGSSCEPAIFPAAPDHVYRNRGDGTFEEMTARWGFDVPNGDGLGIVAADFDNTGTISLFVGNDGRANFFFAPEFEPDGLFRFREAGVISGLAYDESGAAQACMGIGAGDVNNDGLVDLFVTNFYHESNTLYLNLGNRTFSDRTRSFKLREPSWSLLGFGTQFIDADLDGWEDIILVNGHVDDFTRRQIPYKMRPQFFQNERNRFSERFGNEVGSFFDEPKLGRGLARLDWNRDGLNDVVISHIGDPAALLTNRTKNAGHGFGLTLVGISRSRDAIGTRVTVTGSDYRLTRQLTAGDGYQASNERRLEFGLGEDEAEIQIDINWIGGARESFRFNPTQSDYLAIEGRGELLRMSID